MPREDKNDFSQMNLAKAQHGDIDGWVKQGWSGVTQTTLDLLNYWFKRSEDTEDRFSLTHTLHRQCHNDAAAGDFYLSEGKSSGLDLNAVPYAKLI